MKIRPALRSDISAITALEYETYSYEGYPATFIAQAIMQWPTLCIVAEDKQGDILGYALYAPADQAGSCWLMSLLISTNARGQGVGRALTVFGQSHLKELGYTRCLLTVAPENKAGIQLYESLSFVRLDFIEHALGKNEHRYLMAQAL
ncbi:GNAT family N-acetyltransferase [Aliidiomarina taiwanensis]|nr:N-acetyltransferase [Aliidiomarina taiwanensis]